MKRPSRRIRQTGASRSLRRPAHGLVFFAMFAAVAAPLDALQITGTVVDADAGTTLEGVEVSLVTVTDSVVALGVSDAEGRFTLRLSVVGAYRLRAKRLGYAPMTTDFFLGDPSSEMSAELTMSVQAIPLDPVEVTAEARRERLTKRGFYHRVEQGYGHFLLPETLDELSKTALQVTDLLRGMPSIRVASVGGSGEEEVLTQGTYTTRIGKLNRPRHCLPSVSIDGVIVRYGGSAQPDAELYQTAKAASWNTLVAPSDIEAIEVYPRNAGLPAQVSGYVSPCGAILIWTKP